MLLALKETVVYTSFKHWELNNVILYMWQYNRFYNFTFNIGLYYEKNLVNARVMLVNCLSVNFQQTYYLLISRTSRGKMRLIIILHCKTRGRVFFFFSRRRRMAHEHILFYHIVEKMFIKLTSLVTIVCQLPLMFMISSSIM